MRGENEYLIQYSGLKLGIHPFDFEIGKQFFEAYEYSEIEDCEVHVHMTLEKSSTMMVLLFNVKGKVFFPCDRCLETVELPIEGDYRQVVKISDYEEDNEDDEIIVLPSAEYEIDVEKFIYDFIMLSVPLKRAHEEGECNEELVAQLSQYLIEETPEESDDSNVNEEDVDPRWKALMDLKNKKN